MNSNIYFHEARAEICLIYCLLLGSGVLRKTAFDIYVLKFTKVKLMRVGPSIDGVFKIDMNNLQFCNEKR